MQLASIDRKPIETIIEMQKANAATLAKNIPESVERCLIDIPADKSKPDANKTVLLVSYLLDLDFRARMRFSIGYIIVCIEVSRFRILDSWLN
jgi:hypothetical protein